MASSQAQFTSPTAPYSGDHPAFALRLETDSDGKVYACFKTQPGWTYQMESASDISKVFDPEDPSSQDGWTRDAMSFYGAGQEIRTQIYTHPPPGAQPPPVAPDPRPFHFFNINHFQGRSGSLISWGTGSARRSYLSALTFRSTNGPSYGIDSVYLIEPERLESIGVLSWGHLPYSAALESLPALTPAEASIVAIVEGAHPAIVAKLNAINEHLALLSQQATTLPTVPGIKKFFRAVAVEVDTDGDGLPDYIEMDHGLNSFLTDTDGDGYSDLEELLKGSDPRDPNSTPAADAVASNEPYWQVKEKFLSGSWNYVGTSIEGRLRTSAAGIETEVNFAGSPSSANAVLTAASYGYWRKWKATDGNINAEAEYSGLFGSNALDGHHRQVRLFRPQAENNAVSRTALWIKKYESPIGSSPTVTSTEAKEFKISYSQTASAEIEMKPTFVALQKQKEILLPVDLDIVHPATGELDEGNQHDATKGGYVAVRRDDKTPVTKLVLRQGSGVSGMKYKVKFNGADRFKLWKDEARTQAVVSQQTEFDPAQETTLYLEGLKKSTSAGGETLTLQAVINGTSTDAETIYATIVEAEFDVWLNVFIPPQWVDVPPGPITGNPVPELSSTIASGDDRSFANTFLDNPSADVDKVATSSRSHTQVTIIPFKDLDADGIKDQTEKHAMGISHNYAKVVSVPHPGDPYSAANRLLPQPWTVATGRGLTTGMHVTPGTRDDYSMKFRFNGTADNPIVTPSAAIDWDFELQVFADAANVTQPKWKLLGQWQDGFPGYEIYVRDSDGTGGNNKGHPIYQFDPIAVGNSPFDLFPVFGDETITPANGTIP